MESTPRESSFPFDFDNYNLIPLHFYFLIPLHFYFREFEFAQRRLKKYGEKYLEEYGEQETKAVDSSLQPLEEDLRVLSNLSKYPYRIRHRANLQDKKKLFASAPVRSKPRLTYDSTRPARDPEGEYVPMYYSIHTV